MNDICLGAFATLQDAEDAKSIRVEPQQELEIVQDGDVEHPYRIWWHRTGQ